MNDKRKLKEILQFYNISIADFANKINVNYQSLYNLNSEKKDDVKNFNQASLVGIAKFCPEISLYWLITGEGSMLAGSSDHHNAIAVDHGVATVNHAESPNSSVSKTEMLDGIKDSINSLTTIIESLQETNKQQCCQITDLLNILKSRI